MPIKSCFLMLVASKMTPCMKISPPFIANNSELFSKFEFSAKPKKIRNHFLKGELIISIPKLQFNESQFSENVSFLNKS